MTAADEPEKPDTDKKRKRTTGSSSNNPLSDARRVQTQGDKTKKPKSKAEIKAEGLWHRKSGAGYSLFVEYYGGQPLGTVVTGTEREIIPGGDITKDKNGNAGQVAGQSRAAKRRQKKKNRTGSNKNHEMSGGTALTSSVDPNNKNEQPGSAPVPSSSPFTNNPSPLLQTLSKHKNCLHLTPYITSLSKPLPLTFRLRTHFDNPADLSKDSNNHKQHIKALKLSLSKTIHSALVAPVSFDPCNVIYQAHHISKVQLSKAAPALKSLLVEYSANGCIARQELGSMLPVIALSGGKYIKKGSRVLDMCASPGSKTLQALEQVVTPSKDDKLIMKGRVVANDIHPTRLKSLQDAVNRSGLPSSCTSRITYVNHNASTFPTPKSGRLFDAIMADVPCSGDGTIRKDVHVLPMWTPDTGNALHKLQVGILKRALALVKVGGVVCYSTCSLNPVEDEAVVAAAITSKEKKITVEIVKFPTEALPGFVRRDGIYDWKVADYSTEEGEEDEDGNEDFGNLRWYGTHQDAVDAGMSNAKETLWPNVEYNKNINMELCTRLWPQDQDSGGFFVALIKRLS